MIASFFSTLFCLAAFILQQPTTQTKAIAFDFGGVIAAIDRDKMDQFLEVTFHLKQEDMKPLFKRRNEYLSRGGNDQDFWQSYATTKGMVLPENWYDQYVKVKHDSLHALPGMAEIVKSLQSQGYQTALISNVTPVYAAMIRNEGFYDPFYPLLLSYEMGADKPSLDAFHMLLEALHLPAHAVVYIDDQQDNVDAAKQIGIDSIRFVSTEQLIQELHKRHIEVSKNEP